MMTTEQKQQYLVLAALSGRPKQVHEIAPLFKDGLVEGRKLPHIVGDLLYARVIDKRAGTKNTTFYQLNEKGTARLAELKALTPLGASLDRLAEANRRIAPPRVTDIAKLEVTGVKPHSGPRAELNVFPVARPPAPPAEVVALTPIKTVKTWEKPAAKSLPMPDPVVVPPAPVRGGNLTQPVAQPAPAQPSAPAPVQGKGVEEALAAFEKSLDANPKETIKRLARRFFEQEIRIARQQAQYDKQDAILRKVYQMLGQLYTA